jgi:hypothetical protein
LQPQATGAQCSMRNVGYADAVVVCCALLITHVVTVI